MRYLEEKDVGFRVRDAVVPVVSAAILFDLGLVTDRVRPGPKEGYLACAAASSKEVAEGSVGAGTGATVSKALGMERCVKGGIGTSTVALGDGLVVAALAAANAYGDIVDYRTGRIVAGPRKNDGGYHDTVELLLQGKARFRPRGETNTTIGVIATNATLSREQIIRLARASQDGLALTIRPCHTLVDGDTMFALATGKWKGDIDPLRMEAAATEATAQAVLRAVRSATGLGGVPSIKDLSRG
jgi:L-aminopeptidase/D-esterase-like protein